ncbi:hypothetical protein EX30DRAFT_300376 [Ascodesmis nigricans]|uniref:GOLD domain-containing protein n=1 Tax=Ascodesmis nigricans TaxID=341454 RepID=A0A4S2N5J3_9PEZI|nr:hypothetical protein EX30DRAFT_300376 [Ascodesmis nigricans]
MLGAAAVATLSLFVPESVATALTYKLHPSETQCFYISNDKPSSKVAFYFAVQSGGSFDVDYKVTGPTGRIILEDTKERQGEFVFTAKETGEYSFCFSNDMSTFAEKLVDFEIAIENEARAELPSKQGTSPEHLSSLEESLFKLSGQLSTISRSQKYFRTRENRNFSTVRSTESRIFNFSVIESLMMVTMSCLQVFVVRFFFQGARKGEFFPLLPPSVLLPFQLPGLLPPVVHSLGGEDYAVGYVFASPSLMLKPTLGYV